MSSSSSSSSHVIGMIHAVDLGNEKEGGTEGTQKEDEGPFLEEGKEDGKANGGCVCVCVCVCMYE